MPTNTYKEIFPYVSLFATCVSSILALVIACTIRRLAGRGWLIASVALTLISRAAFQIISLLARSHGYSSSREVYQWFDVANLLPLFGTACFGLFLFANWSASRMKLEMGNLLFSFTGRIPRSAFWISVGLLFPLGTVLGFAPYTSEASGAPKVMIWTVYGLWCVLSLWISLAVYAKRWHDCGKSGWMSLVMLVPIVGPLWLLGVCGFVQGDSGPNEYGDNPLNLPRSPGAPAQTPSQFTFSCPHCGQHISAATDVAGTQSSCPTCNNSLTVPWPTV
jgi:uncharacterized membrane protein YhaH (DUF805 family)